jgi:hypothetical protein
MNANYIAVITPPGMVGSASELRITFYTMGIRPEAAPTGFAPSTARHCS